jgi:16S rRNA (adenine1518-N6/adenine1519-N6)-dimethyltransferase
MVMMLQKEATERMLAFPGSKTFNALSIFLQACYKTGGRHAVPGQCFFPAPSVDSALLRMDRLKNKFPFPKHVRVLIRRVFTQRRKQLGSLIKNENSAIQEIMLSWLKRQNLCPSIRPEKITVLQWTELARSLSEER